MRPFRYEKPASVREAVRSVAADREARFVAGGTTLLDLAKLDVERPSAVVDIGALPLTRIETLPDGRMRVGALVTNRDLAEDPAVQRRYPVLSQALLSGASPQIRNMATVGGNLMQRTRCPYFRDTVYACNKRAPGSGCAAIQGDNRTHAVLGTSARCIATHPSDMAVALVALDAIVLVQAPGAAVRTIPAVDFHVAYGEDPAKETRLAHGELITAVELPAERWRARSIYIKVRDRASFEFALASAAVALDLTGGRIGRARIALGGVATKPWRCREAEAQLEGTVADGPAFRRAAEAALRGARAARDNAFKIELARRTLVHALERAAALPV